MVVSLALVAMPFACTSALRGGSPASPATVVSVSPAGSAVAPPLAYPRDRAARARIDAAIDDLYLKGRENDAEAELKGIYAACGDGCSAPVKACAWMYIGLIWGNQGQRPDLVREAFRFALALDPGIQLDEALAAPATKQGFELERARAVPVSGTSPAPSALPPTQ